MWFLVWFAFSVMLWCYLLFRSFIWFCTRCLHCISVGLVCWVVRMNVYDGSFVGYLRVLYTWCRFCLLVDVLFTHLLVICVFF